MNVHIRLLKNTKTDLEGNLRLDCSLSGIRFRKYLGIKVKSKNWNKNKERLTSSASNAFNVNKRLDIITKKVIDIYYELQNDEVPISISVLNEKFDEQIKGKSNKVSFFDFAYQYVENSKSIKNEGTCQGYLYTIKSLKEFEKYSRRRIDWNTFDHKFYTTYEKFQYTIKGNSQNLFGRRIIDIKAILNNAFLLGINKYTMYKLFKVKKISVKREYLNDDELEKLRSLDLSKNKRLEKVRDIFLVCSLTGVRFSDFKNLKLENIELGENGRLIKYFAKKTQKHITTLCTDVTLNILKKYNFNLPSISNQKMNLNIKVVCELAGINNNVIVNTYKCGKPIQFQKKKYQLISSHTARRSFTTNLVKKGISNFSVMTATGHKKESTFLKYVQSVDNEIIDNIYKSLNRMAN
ncbi:MAG: site-specific integrase [Flavobacteriales bacterium]|jgi:integrase|nr:site-specific integrase [Flavobacteriales bacterium]MDG2059934.1 tyrosine-type recombinase/integrase [Flavobacteriales bacterium]